MPPPEVLISLHDVTPAHAERIARAEALFAELGVRKITYLLVPDFHGAAPADRQPDFVDWCRAERAFDVDWVLHGFRHLESTKDAQRVGATSARLKRRLLTAGEGEFLALPPEEIRRRLDAGTAVFRSCSGDGPAGFVAPAWLFGPDLPPILRELGFRFHEDHRRVHDLATGRSLTAPVITWATRTRLRRWTSVYGCPVLLRAWSGAPLLRLAVHPHDLDHDDTVRSIRSVWRTALRSRVQRHYSEVLD